MTHRRANANAIALLVQARRGVFDEMVSEVRAAAMATDRSARDFWLERCDLSEVGWNTVQGAIQHLQRTGGA